MMTFEQVDKHVESLDIDALKLEAPATRAARATPEEIVGKICGVYSKARPVLEFLANFGWIIPQKWRDVIRAVLIQFDKICPPTV